MIGPEGRHFISLFFHLEIQVILQFTKVFSSRQGFIDTYLSSFQKVYTLLEYKSVRKILLFNTGILIKLYDVVSVSR